MTNNIIKNKSGGTLLILTIIMLTAVLTIVMAVADIVRNGLIIDRTQLESTKAFFAAEAGAERILYDARKNPLFPGDFPTDFPVKCQPPDSSSAPYDFKQFYCFDSISIPLSIIENCEQPPNDPNNCINVDYQVLSSNNSEYRILYNNINDGNVNIISTTTITSYGKFRNVGRNIQLMFRD